MPAAAVTPAPIAYIKVVAVKKLVVGYLGEIPDPPGLFWVLSRLLSRPSIQLACFLRGLFSARSAIWIFYFEKIRVFKAGVSAVEYISME